MGVSPASGRNGGNERQRRNEDVEKAGGDQEKAEVERWRLMIATERNLESEEGRMEKAWVHLQKDKSRRTSIQSCWMRHSCPLSRLMINVHS